MVDGVIFIHDAHLTGERHLFIVAHQAVAQQVRKCHDERLRTVGRLGTGGLLDHIQGVEQKVRVDLAAQLLQPAALHAVLQLQCFGLLAVQLPLDLVFLLQGGHLLGHGVLHDVEGLGQLSDLRLLGQRDVRGVELTFANGAGGSDHLLHRREQTHDHQTGNAAQRHAQRHHHRLQHGDALVQGRDGGVGGLGILNGGFQQLQGVLAQVIAAGHHLCIIQLGSCGIVAAEQVVFQLIQQAGVGLIDRIHCAVEHPLLIADAFQTVQAGTDAPEPCVAGGRCRLQPVNDLLRLAVLPAVVLQHGNRAFHTALKAADGVEAAHLRVLYCLHCSGLVAIERELHGKGRKKCCQTQAHALLEGDLPLAVLQSLPPPFVW